MSTEPSMSRQYSATDRWLMRLQQQLAPVLQPPSRSTATYPADASADAEEMGEVDRAHAAGLMRVNHAGEVAAQALYHGQALVARNEGVREHLLAAARDEQAHLQWCEQRLNELGHQPSVLRPLWYAGSMAIGAAAGLAGDRWSLGFVAETERQVAEHLAGHLDQLPAADRRSRAVVAAMRQDEIRHGNDAEHKGGEALPPPVRGLMRQAAKVMKLLAYRI